MGGSDRSRLLASDNNLAEAIFCKKEAVVTKLLEHIFNLSIVIDVEERIVPCPLHLDYICLCEMVSAEDGVGAGRLMEEGKHQTSWLQDLVDASQDWGNQRLGQIIDGVPENDDIERAT